jgi:FAD/FMN-containing dehydrogenase/Fe-S oxidoreductase
MNRQNSHLSLDFQAEISRRTSGELRLDPVSRMLYSTDASIYQIEPLGVYFPRRVEDLQVVVEICAREHIPVLPRGAGSSLAGQAIGPALILDVSRYLDQKIEINPLERVARVEPGVNLSRLNREAKRHGLHFGPDPASADRATVAGSVANNATGAHSILYGMAGDHLLAVETLLSDGQSARFEAIPLASAEYRSVHAHGTAERAMYQAALEIRQQSAQVIKQNWPSVWRRAAGYAIQYLLPWSPGKPPMWNADWNQANLPYPPVNDGMLNLAPLFAGSEGTLGVITALELRLVPLPDHTILAVRAFPDIESACDATPELLSLSPSAIELIPGSLLRLARSIPAYAHQLSFVQGDPAALLVLEFSGKNPEVIKKQAEKLGDDVFLAVTPEQQQQVWNIRKMGLGILNSRPGGPRPLAFIEDLAVPVERLGEFVRQMNAIMAEHATYAEIYAHASAGCLHIRPVLDLKSPVGIQQLRSIASQAVSLTLNLGGAVSGEHGTGLARSEWLEQAYGVHILTLFRKIKTAADPHGLFNPGKILDAPAMDTNLRYSPGYQTTAWKTRMDFSRHAGLDGAIELCNGAGVCLKDTGVMCPSFQVTREEEHSTRGRANLLRLLISGQFASERLGLHAVHEALDLCLECKGCSSECPSSVDMARLKIEFLHHYHTREPRKVRDFLFAYLPVLARFAHPLAPFINRFTTTSLYNWIGSRFGIAPQRPFPRLASRINRLDHLEVIQSQMAQSPGNHVLVLTDVFTHYFQPEIEVSAIRVLKQAGYCPWILPFAGAGRTYLSKGFLEQAIQHLQALVSAIQRIDPEGSLPIVGLEPSEIYTLSDELVDLLPGNRYAFEMGKRAWMLDEFLLRPKPGDSSEWQAPLELLEKSRRQVVFVHGHCHQKARPPAADGLPVGVAATRAILSKAGYQVQEIESGCCGMAGAFGYEAEHYQLSMSVGELVLLPAVRSAPPDCWIVAAGTSCRSQIEDGSGRPAYHPVLLLDPDFPTLFPPKG